MLFFNKKVIDKIGLWDENYFLYLEDLDFCLGMRKMGYKIVFDPLAKIKHKGGASSNSKYNIVLKHWYNSRNYFFTKHLGQNQGKIIKLIFSIEIKLLSLYHHLRHETAE